MRVLLQREIVKWITVGYNGLDRKLIIYSFKGCVLTTAVHGSEDENFHYLRKTSLVVQSYKGSRDCSCVKDSFDRIRESNVEDTAPCSLISDASQDTEVIDVR